jgi:glycosyltransferase involved in cell wall biosynthesis
VRKALFIANGIWSEGDVPAISGGDIRWIEIAKQWQELGIEVHVLTTKAGVELCKKLGLDAFFYTIKARNNYSLLSYMERALKSFTPSTELKKFNGVIYSSTEHWYDVIPGSIIKKNNPNNTFVVVAHWVAPLIRKGTSVINSLLFYINQRVGFKVAKKYADLILAVSEPTAQALKSIGMPAKKVKTVEAGVHYDEIRKIASHVKEKEFDGIFMKRFDKTKGIFDVIEIWRKVVDEIPNAKLALVGHGTKNIIEKLKRIILTEKLENNIKIVGPIYDFNRKIEMLAKSKVFLLPSYEENWAIVIGEALATGIPVVAYELPEIKPIWKDSVVWVSKGDKESFANEVIKLLVDEELRNTIAFRGINYVRKYNWKNIARRELELVLSSSKNS